MARSLIQRGKRFFSELRRRRVYRVVAIYGVLAVGGLEIASVVLPSTRLPGWFDELFLGLVIVCFPLVVVLAWTFDLKEGRIERTGDASEGAGGPWPEPAGRVAVSESARPGEGAARIPPVGEAPPVGADEGEITLDPMAVAVLPFENLSASEAAEPFALGLHDDLLTELSRASALTVISRTSVKGYRGTTKTMREIARELGAGTIVEAGVQQSGARVRLNVQLIDARTDAHLWAERYDRELSAENIFELQSELAARIMAELHATLTREEQSRVPSQPTGDLEAYQLFANGRQALIDRSEEGFRTAATLFEQAIHRDPQYALAWAGLADALIGLVDYGHIDSDETLQRGAETARRALELDPGLAEGHSAWGRLRTAVRDAPGAARAHGRAIELRPSYAGAYQWSCWAHLLLNEGEAAVEFGERATRLDPFDPEAAGNLACARLMVGDPGGALTEVQRILVRHPGVEWPLWVEGLALLALGRTAEGAERLGRLRERWTRGWSEVGEALAAIEAGQTPPFDVLIDRAAERGEPFKVGLLHALRGDADRAFQEIRGGMPLSWDDSLFLYVHRGRPLDALRADPRFQPLLADVVESWRAEDA